jgi:hypothetical protein
MALPTRKPETTMQIKIVPDRKSEVKPDFSRRPLPRCGTSRSRIDCCGLKPALIERHDCYDFGRNREWAVLTCA